MDTKQLYQEVILDHNKRPRNYGSLEDSNRSSEGYNPFCGDRITVSLQVDSEGGGEVIEGIAFQGESCAICKASASMMTMNVRGKSVEEAEHLFREFRDMVTGNLDVERQTHRLGRLRLFSGVRDLPTRVKCAVLPWHTLHAAIHEQENASTEGVEGVDLET